MKICFYSAILDVELFNRVGFYRDDITALSLNGDDVYPTNKLMGVFECKPDLVIGYFYSKAVIAAIIGRFRGSKVILTGGADQISPVLVAGARLFSRRFFAFIGLLVAHRLLLSCTDDVVNFNKLTFGFRFLKNKIELVNHVVIPTCTPQCSSAHKQKEFNAFTLCWMGSEDNAIRKGVDKSIELIAKLREQGVDARLAIAGTDGPARPFLQKMSEGLGVGEYISFLGAISEEEKKKRFASNSVYLQLSKHEGFGVAAAEAFFSGMIVVHSNKGGLKDVIGGKGIVFDSGVLDNDETSVHEFYLEFLDYKIDLDVLVKELGNYSIVKRSNAFLGS